MVRLMNFKEMHEKKVQEVNQILNQYLPKEEGLQKTVMSAMNYSIAAGGKRVRPLLMLESFRFFEGQGQVIQPFMAALEMIHTYSLVHDDLPAMDDDEFRRGKKTTHIAFGEAAAILAGDGLLNFAFETACQAFEMKSDPKIVGSALNVLSKKAGIYGMIGGQMVDIESEGKEISKEQLDFIYRLKTGALLEAAMMIGGILAGATREEVLTLETIGQKIGLSFQIQDDILDVTSSTQILGKPVYSDEKNQKTTYVSLFGIDQARKEAKKVTAEALEALESLGSRKEFLRDYVIELINREK